jgi:LAO/AO transport system kinase
VSAEPNLERLSASLAEGDKAPLADALALLERAPEAADTLALLDEAWTNPRAQVIGLTGPPGVGKSTLARALIMGWRFAHRTVGVIAVDPSSRRSGGALLGDRTRLGTDPADTGIFVRSMAARNRLGGLADLTLSSMVLMRALFDIVLVETVGVGQSETDVADTTDTVLFCVQPGSGDSLQFMKAGIVETPDVIAVNKADLGATAERARADVAGALTLGTGHGVDAWQVPVLAVSAQHSTGIDELEEVLDAHWGWLRRDGRLAARRGQQAEIWIRAAILDRFGREGLRRVGKIEYDNIQSPFRAASDLTVRLNG